MVSSLFFIVYTCRRIPYAQYALNRLPRFRFNLLGKILGISVWTMVQNFLSLATWFLFFLSVEHLGESSLAATNIVRNISSFTFMTVIALASTASTLQQPYWSRTHRKRTPNANRVVRMGFVVFAPLIAVIGFFPDAVMSIFTNDAALKATVRGALYVMLSSYIFTIPAQILFHSVSGTGNTRTALVIEATALFIYCIYIGIVIFHFRVALPYCWLSERIYAVFALIFSFIYLKFGNWQKKQF